MRRLLLVVTVALASAETPLSRDRLSWCPLHENTTGRSDDLSALHHW
jgi:hypothetical protein